MSSFLNWFVIILTVGNILACLWLIRWSSKPRPGEASTGDVTGHVWDQNLEEYNNPLPRWWLWLFYITIVFGFGYLALYPGLGNFAGALGWSQAEQYQGEMARADDQYGPIFTRYAGQPVAQLAGDPEAMASGRRLFLTYCAQCHGSDAGGAPGAGFPSLRDSAWLYGGDPEAIKASILEGRRGMMPPMAAAVGGDAGAAQVAHYVLSLAGQPHDGPMAEAGRPKFAACAACHGADARGSAANGLGPMGAPDLTDDFWLYGGSFAAIVNTIRAGRSGNMPAHRDFLGQDKAHLLAAYVISVSEQADKGR